MTWRIGAHYGVHVYDDDRPVATFHNAEDAQRAVKAMHFYEAVTNSQDPEATAYQLIHSTDEPQR